MIETRNRIGEVWNIGGRNGKTFSPKTKEDYTPLHDSLSKTILNLKEKCQIGSGNYVRWGSGEYVGSAYGLSLISNGISVQIGDNRQHVVDISSLKSGLGFRGRIEDFINDLEASRARLYKNIEVLKESQLELLGDIDTSWAYEDRYRALIDERDKLFIELGGNQVKESACFEEGEEIDDTTVDAEEQAEEDDNANTDSGFQPHAIDAVFA
jgi:hypothetical protein